VLYNCGIRLILSKADTEQKHLTGHLLLAVSGHHPGSSTIAGQQLLLGLCTQVLTIDFIAHNSLTP
jgi:hypothetical protein